MGKACDGNHTYSPKSKFNNFRKSDSTNSSLKLEDDSEDLKAYHTSGKKLYVTTQPFWSLKEPKRLILEILGGKLRIINRYGSQKTETVN